jgi:hypothetical protein
MPIPNYRLTRENVNAMPLDSHLFNLGGLGLHTNINRSDPDQKNQVFICLTRNGYMIAMTKDRYEKGEGENFYRSVVVGTNISREDFFDYAEKYDGVNSPKQQAKNMEAFDGFVSKNIEK